MSNKEHEPDALARASWFAVNAYGVLIGLLVIIVSTSFFLGAHEGLVMAWSAHIGYFISGWALLWSYWKVRVDIEVYASGLLVMSNVLMLAHQTIGVGTFSPRSALITLALIFVVVLRVGAIIHGGVFILPHWKKKL